MVAETTTRDAFEDCVQYAKRHNFSELLQEYVVRVLRERPSDPIAFLMDEITKRPFVPKSSASSNPFYRDPAADGSEARLKLAASCGLFFRDRGDCARAAEDQRSRNAETAALLAKARSQLPETPEDVAARQADFARIVAAQDRALGLDDDATCLPEGVLDAARAGVVEVEL